MKAQPFPVKHDLLLVGAGHAQVAVLRRLMMKPVPGLRALLVNDHRLTPYSGMLPGVIAGKYDPGQMFLDVDRMCVAAGVSFVQDRAIWLDPTAKRLGTAGGITVEGDTLSLNLGGAALSPLSKDQSTGAVAPPLPDWLLTAKPIGAFWRAWNARLAALPILQDQPVRLVVVGSGAAGVELALACQRALENRFADQVIEVSLIGSSALVLPTLGARAGRQTLAKLKQRRIHYLAGHRAKATPEGLFVNGQRIDCDICIWAAGVGAPPLLADSGLACDAQGFARVGATLESISHQGIFVTGDSCAFDPKPLAKAGVYSVRMGPVLGDNLVRRARGQGLKPYHPQANTLFLLGDGSGDALAYYGPLSGWHPAAWRWKDHIDRTFMDRFGAQLSKGFDAMSAKVVATRGEAMRCEGCGSKVQGQGLANVLGQVGVNRAGDVGALSELGRQDDGTKVVQSVDGISSPIGDPYMHGYAAVLHALSDLYVAGTLCADSSPWVAVNVVVEQGTPMAEARQLALVMQGVQRAIADEGATLITGHSSTGPKDYVSVTVTGLIRRPWQETDGAASVTSTAGGVSEGWQVVLSKPLGVGVMLAARGLAQPVGRHMQGVIEGALGQSNRPAAQALWHLGATSMTDVTGFGLAKHLGDLLTAKQIAVIERDCLPTFDGVVVLSQQGVRSSLWDSNVKVAGFEPSSLSPLEALCFDPQTCGGVVALVPPSVSASVLKAHDLFPIGHIAPKQTVDQSQQVTRRRWIEFR